MTVFPSIPDRLTVVIGPTEVFPSTKRRMAKAYEHAQNGDRTLVDELLEYQQLIARGLIGQGTKGPLARAIETTTDTFLETFEARVGWGIFKDLYCATISVDLDNTKIAGDQPLGHFLTDENQKLIATIVGLATKAEWILINHKISKGGNYTSD